jgi:hypothetical protein
MYVVVVLGLGLMFPCGETRDAGGDRSTDDYYSGYAN